MLCCVRVCVCVCICTVSRIYVLLSACVGRSTLAACIEKLLFVFCGPKIGARFWTPKWGHDIQISSPVSKFVAPILDPWYMRPRFCKECLELRQAASFIHVFLCLVPRCRFHMQSTLWGKAKSMQAHGPKNGPASQRYRNVSKGAGMPVLFCSKHVRLNFDSHKRCKDICTASAPWTQPPAPPDIIPSSTQGLGCLDLGTGQQGVYYGGADHFRLLKQCQTPGLAMRIIVLVDTSSTAQGGGGSFKNRKPIGGVGCCESRMAEQTHWWTESWLELCFLEWLQCLQWSPHQQLLDVVWCSAVVVAVVVVV